MTKFGRITREGGAYFYGSSTSPPQAGGAAALLSLQFWEFLSIYAYTLFAELPDLTGNTWREGLFYGVSHGPNPRGRAPSLHNLGVPFNLCVHPLTQNYKFDVVTNIGMALV